jgi:hypothetical protein
MDPAARFQHPMKMGGGRGSQSFRMFFACSGIIAGRQDVPATHWFRATFSEIAGRFAGPIGAASHDHGMERARHFDEVLGAFNTNPFVER